MAIPGCQFRMNSNQAIGKTCEGFILVGKVRRSALNLSHAFLVGAEEEAFAICLPALTLAGEFIFPSGETGLRWY